jgi:hypothetical protein
MERLYLWCALYFPWLIPVIRKMSRGRFPTREIVATPSMLIHPITSTDQQGIVSELNQAAKCIEGAPAFYLRASAVDATQYVADTPKGQEVWIFCSPMDTWMAMGGRFGLARVMTKEVVDDFVLLMN